MFSQQTLADLGWSAFFNTQLDIDDLEAFEPARVFELHRGQIRAFASDGPVDLRPTGDLQVGEVAVGDWVLFDRQTLEVARLLERRSLIQRRAAGTEARGQLIAANIDSLLIVTSCNDDFNEARLERYLALAFDAGVQPVIIATKIDLAADPDAWRARGERVAADVPSVTLDLINGDPAKDLAPWCGPGQTLAMVGSSGVGKSTLFNHLCGTDAATATIREHDAKGRHTTTGRLLSAMHDGGWLIDTPGMRELQMLDAGDGIDAVFQDLANLAATCRFRDCAHEQEPGCAVQAAIQAGELEPQRLQRWKKLKLEDRHNSETVAQSRQRMKQFGKKVKSAMDTKKRRQS